MLVEFTVGNYRSIKEPVTLSAVATKQRKTAATGKRRPGVVPDEEIAPAYPVEGRGFGLLPVLGIFGANASGKSNVLRGLDDFLRFTTDEPAHAVVPFRLDSDTPSQPTTFEVTLAIEGILYTYGLHLKAERIVQETLEYAPSSTGRTRLLFKRIWSEGANKAEWKNGNDFSGPHIQLQERIKENELFLAVVTRYLDITPILPLRRWLNERWKGLGTYKGISHHELATYLVSVADPRSIPLISNFVHALDTWVDRVELGESGTHIGQREIYAVHCIGGKEVRLPFSEESKGTNQILDIAYSVIRTLDSGNLLLMDEFDGSLHPEITQTIVKLFQRPDTNPKRAQLIFTSHDNTLMRGNLLRRDQIWFTEKRRNQSTSLYPLSDYRLRNDALIDLKYLNGRFGAIPVLPADYDLRELLEVGRK